MFFTYDIAENLKIEYQKWVNKINNTTYFQREDNRTYASILFKILG